MNAKIGILKFWGGYSKSTFHHFDEVLTSVPPQGDLDRNRTQVLPVRLQIFNREQSSSNELFVVNIGHFWEYLN